MELRIGTGTHYCNRGCVATVSLSDSLKLCDAVSIRGRSYHYHRH